MPSNSAADIESIIEIVRAKLIKENKEKEQRGAAERSINGSQSFVKTGDHSTSILKEIDDNTPSVQMAQNSFSKGQLGTNRFGSQTVFNGGDWYKSGYWKTKYLH